MLKLGEPGGDSRARIARTTVFAACAMRCMATPLLTVRRCVLLGRRRSDSSPELRTSSNCVSGQEALDATDAQTVDGCERCSGGAGTVIVDHVDDCAVAEAVSHAPRLLGRGQRGGNAGDGACPGATLEVSEPSGVRVSRQHLHRSTPDRPFRSAERQSNQPRTATRQNWPVPSGANSMTAGSITSMSA